MRRTTLIAIGLLPLCWFSACGSRSVQGFHHAHDHRHLDGTQHAHEHWHFDDGNSHHPLQDPHGDAFHTHQATTPSAAHDTQPSLDLPE